MYMDPESQRAAASENELLGAQHAPEGLQERGETEECVNCSGGVERGPGSNHTLRKCASHQGPVPAVTLAAVIVFLLITIIAIATLAELLRVEKSKPPLAAPGPPAVPCCPDGWIGYRGKCYYFSETEGNWTYSQSQCSALNASLAGIDSEQEKMCCSCQFQVSVRAACTIVGTFFPSRYPSGRAPWSCGFMAVYKGPFRPTASSVPSCRILRQRGRWVGLGMNVSNISKNNSYERISCYAIRVSSTVGLASRGSQASPGDGPTAPNSTSGFR
ncbi:C-type lectin domain family 2 member L isoform X1 [Chelonia mydas]|uniref:C-type lectin domain family 2 member L isoform X1 n=1 Tax=Chelonia mydas TaxID=8469 RepID=UPI0018A1F5AF|nr:C-type lectin domain family 2 member L isoform X1 [Chelonia mydas]